MAINTVINQCFKTFKTSKHTAQEARQLKLPANIAEMLRFEKLQGYVDSLPNFDKNTVEGMRIATLKQWFNDRYVKPDRTMSVQLREAAYDLMRVSEKDCKQYNNSFVRPPITIMARARELVYRVLGPLDIPGILDAGSFSSGASIGYKRLNAHPANKYSSLITVTPRAEKYLRALIAVTPRWDVEGAQYRVKLVPGNKVTTVPKDAEKDRAIAIEPSGNMYLQLAVGTHLKRRLKSAAGIDLHDQTLNQRLARVGSFTTLLSTIDLKRASDSISMRIVEELLPSDWYRFLCDLRSPVGTIDGISHFKWEKFSSMGNGFTFELESLLFYCIVVSTLQCNLGTPVVSVYGDDLIVPTPKYSDITTALQQCGFTINEKKSCHTGNFRESCGGFYYKGASVWPIRPKKPIENLPDLIVFLNQVSRWSLCEHTNMALPYFLPLIKKIHNACPYLRLFRGSLDEGASALRSSGVNHLYLQPMRPRIPRETAFHKVHNGGLLSWFQKQNDLLYNGNNKSFGAGSSGAYVIKRRNPADLQYLSYKYDLIDHY